jgi:hypothetical protein
LVEALCYKLEGRGFKSRMRWSFSIYLILQPHYGPGVDSAPKRNEYQESSWEVKSGRRVGLTTLPPSMSRMSENVGGLTSRNPKDLHGLYKENFTLPLPQLNNTIISNCTMSGIYLRMSYIPPKQKTTEELYMINIHYSHFCDQLI